MKTRIWALFIAILLSFPTLFVPFPSMNIVQAQEENTSKIARVGYEGYEEIEPHLAVLGDGTRIYVTSFGDYIMDKDYPNRMTLRYRDGTVVITNSVFWVNATYDGKVLALSKLAKADINVLVANDTVFEFNHPLKSDGGNVVGNMTVTYQFSKDMKPKISILYENTLLSGWQITWCLLPTKTFLKTNDTYAEALSVTETLDFGSRTSVQLGIDTRPKLWNMWTLVTWEDYGEAIAYGGLEKVLGGKGVTVVFPINETFVDPSVQVEHVYYDANPSFQRRNFHANDYFWQFYVDEWDYDFCYESSADGETWANKVVIYGGGDPFQESMRATEVGIYLETNTLVHMVYANYDSEAEAGSRHTIYYRTGTLGEGSVTLGTQYEVFNGNGFNAPTVTVDSNGYPWIGYNVDNAGYYVKKATTTSGSSWGSATQLFTPDACSFFYHGGVILPLDNGKMYVVWEDNHPDCDTYGVLYDGSWGTPKSIWVRSDLSDSHHNKMRYSVVKKSNNDIIYFRDARYHQTNGDVDNNGTWVYEYDYSGDSWSRTKQVSTGGTVGFITINKTTDDMWFFYTHTNTGSEDVGNGIYYVKYTNSSATWGDEVTVDATITGMNHLHGFYEPRDGYLGVAYVLNDWLYFTFLTENQSPTIGEFQAPSIVYANEYFLLNATIGDVDGVADFNNATIELNGTVVLKWDNSTNTFSEESDPNNYCTLNASASIRTTVNSTAYKLSWSIQLASNYTEGSISILSSNTKVYDSAGASGSGSHANLFTFDLRPTIGEFQAPSTVYANEYFFLNTTINDNSGIADFNNVTIELNGSIVLKWINSTNTFSEESDASYYCLVNASACIRTTVNSTAYKLSWATHLAWNYTEGAISILSSNTIVYDSAGGSASGSHTDLFTFEDDLIMYSASVDPTATYTSAPVTFEGTIYWEGTSTPPTNTTGITAKVEWNYTEQGSTTTIDANGQWTATVTTPSSPDTYSYNVYTLTDETSTQNQTVELIVMKRPSHGGVGPYIPSPPVERPEDYVYEPPEYFGPEPITKPDIEWGLPALVSLIIGLGVIGYVSQKIRRSESRAKLLKRRTTLKRGNQRRAYEKRTKTKRKTKR